MKTGYIDNQFLLNFFNKHPNRGLKKRQIGLGKVKKKKMLCDNS